MVLAKDHTSPEPWAAEQWMPDEEGWKPDEGTREVDANCDPRDETEIRPHVAFDLKEGSNVRALFDDLIAHAVNYHDLMTFAAKDGVVPAFIRFAWETPRSEVDAVADWLRSQPLVVRAVSSHGGPVPRPNEE